MDRWCALFLVGALAGCAPAVPAAGPEFDGAYRGQNTLIAGGGYLCGDLSHPEAFAVSGGRFAYSYAVNPPRTVPIPVQIGADGSIRGQLQYGTDDYLPRSIYRNVWVFVSGGIADGTLRATITDNRCTRQLTAQR